jgi:hypothetical protein
MRGSGFTKVLVFAAGASFLGGCHTYRATGTPPVGSTVRVHVPVTSALSRAPETASVEGLLVSMGDTLTLETQTRRELGAFRELVQVDTFRLATAQAALVEVREFSTSRSVILGVVVAAGAGLAAAYAFGLGGGQTPPDPGPPPPVSAVVSSSLVQSLVGLVFR